MANRDKKYKKNSPGKYYVDTECIACDACQMIAPKHFSLDEDSGQAFISLQPVIQEEEDLCQEAMESCPVEAIGNNGKT